MHGNIGDYDTKSQFFTLATSAKSTGPVIHDHSGDITAENISEKDLDRMAKAS